jgi:hypothetical protein
MDSPWSPPLPDELDVDQTTPWTIDAVAASSTDTNMPWSPLSALELPDDPWTFADWELTDAQSKSMQNFLSVLLSPQPPSDSAFDSAFDSVFDFEF